MSILKLKNVFYTIMKILVFLRNKYIRDCPYTSENLCFYNKPQPTKDKHHFLSKVRGDLMTESMRSSPTSPRSQKRKALI